MRFFTGLHHPADSRHFEAAFVSVNVLRDRKSPIQARDWIMDSGAFSTILKHGGYPRPVSEYAGQIVRFKDCGNLLAAVSQDYMCEPSMLEITGLTVAQHQALTIERYDELIACDTGVYIMPVLQGYQPREYVEHIRMYGDRLAHGAWVGVGSVCKRNGKVSAVESVLLAIYAERPDLRLHGFGLKGQALSSGLVQELLHSADSMAWSYSARMAGRNGNDWREAQRWSHRITSAQVQAQLFVLT